MHRQTDLLPLNRARKYIDFSAENSVGSDTNLSDQSASSSPEASSVSSPVANGLHTPPVDQNQVCGQLFCFCNAHTTARCKNVCNEKK